MTNRPAAAPAVLARRFTDRVVIITGATGGLGRACALRLAAEGASVVVTGRREDACQAVAREVEMLGARALALRTDVTAPDDVERMVAATLDTFGRLDGAVNNAGISPPPVLKADFPDDVWRQTFDLNVHAVFRCMRAELQHMVPAGSGAIVNIASYAAAVVQARGIPAYAAAKHAVFGMTRAAARDHAANGVRVNAVGPGHMRTAMIDRLFESGGESALYARIPMGRVAEPEEVAGTVAFMLSDDASFVTGQMLVADGGLSI